MQPNDDLGDNMLEMIGCYVHLMQEKWSEETTYKYQRFLNDFAYWLDGRIPNEIEISNWLQFHTEWGKSSKRIAICALRGYFLWSMGKSKSPAHKIPFPIYRSPPQRSLNFDQLNNIFSKLDPSTAKGSRDSAIILLMIDSGLRSSELCKLSLKYLNLSDRHFMVEVKGGEWGEGAFSEKTAGMIDRWLDHRLDYALSYVETVFVSVGGNTPGRPLTRYGLTVIFRYIGNMAELDHFSPHDLRRTFATLSIRNGAPSRVVQVAGRWKTLRQVEHYSRAIRAEDLDPFFPSSNLS